MDFYNIFIAGLLQLVGLYFPVHKWFDIGTSFGKMI